MVFYQSSAIKKNSAVYNHFPNTPYFTYMTLLVVVLSIIGFRDTGHMVKLVLKILTRYFM